jgi:rhodanese-related sulfurtransferase
VNGREADAFTAVRARRQGRDESRRIDSELSPRKHVDPSHDRRSRRLPLTHRRFCAEPPGRDPPGRTRSLPDSPTRTSSRSSTSSAGSRGAAGRGRQRHCFSRDTWPIGCDQLLARTERAEVVVLDVRPREEFEAGHIPGAISIPLDELRERLGELARDLEVVAYCRGPYCVLAPQAVAFLGERGIRARRLDEGLPEWRLAGLPVAVGAR